MDEKYLIWDVMNYFNNLPRQGTREEVVGKLSNEEIFIGLEWEAEGSYFKVNGTDLEFEACVYPLNLWSTLPAANLLLAPFILENEFESYFECNVL